MDNLKYLAFNEINIHDEFFNSLKSDYSEFESWFNKKSLSNEKAYVLFGDESSIDGFMYLKIEDDVNDINPPLPIGSHLKIGTFKFNQKGTLRGQRFIKKIFDTAVTKKVDSIYVTVFEKQSYLIKLFKKYGFITHGVKNTVNGIESVLVRNIKEHVNDIVYDYPFISTKEKQKAILSIDPPFHTRLFPDSILKTESSSIIEDVSQTNSIHKIFLSGAKDAARLNRGDILLIYRSNKGEAGPAEYHSVITSICVVEEVRHINSFRCVEEVLDYALKFSVFDESQLREFYKLQRYPYFIKFTYNYALPKRPTRAKIIEAGVSRSDRIVCLFINDNLFSSILKLGKTDESIIID